MARTQGNSTRMYRWQHITSCLTAMCATENSRARRKRVPSGSTRISIPACAPSAEAIQLETREHVDTSPDLVCPW